MTTAPPPPPPPPPHPLTLLTSTQIDIQILQRSFLIGDLQRDIAQLINNL